MAEVSPPVGFNLFVLQTMSGKDINTVALAALPFFFLLVVAVAIITVFPQIVMVLPHWLFPVERFMTTEEYAMKTHLTRIRSCTARRRALRLAGAGRWRRPNGICRPPIRPTTSTPRTSYAFAKDVDDATGGKLQITVHAGRLAVQGARDQARGADRARRRSARC